VSGQAAYRKCEGGLALKVRVTPNAASDRIEGCYLAGDGTMSLRVRVTAQAEKGRANKAVIALVAMAVGRPKSALEVTSRARDRNKTIAIRGEFAELARRIDTLLKA